MPRVLSDEEVHQFRADLCAAAEKLFRENGYESVTMRALAAELGCSPMTPYRYFANRDAIFAAVRTAAFVRFGAVFEKLDAEHADPLVRLRAYAFAYVGFAREDPAAYRIMFELARPSELAPDLLDPAIRGKIVAGWTPLVRLMEQLVDQDLALGDPLDLAHQAWIMLHGLVTLELSNRYLLGRDLDQLIEPCLESFFRGIGAPPNSHQAGANHGATPG